MRLNETLRYWRRARHMRQSDVAGILGVTRNTIARWEAGTSQPKAEQVADLVAIFQVRPGALLGEEVTDEPGGNPAAVEEVAK